MTEPLSLELWGPRLWRQLLDAFLSGQPGLSVVPGNARIAILFGEDWPRRLSLHPAPSRRVLVCLGGPEELALASRLGIEVFVGAEDPTPVLVQGIHAAAACRPFCSEPLLPALLAALRGDSAGVLPRSPCLTPREREVAQHAARGLSNARIAATLGVSQSTVKAHLLHVFAKLGVECRTELAHRLVPAGRDYTAKM